MDAFPCSPYPHHTWLAQWIGIQPPCIFDIVECRHVTHHIMLTVTGAADVLWSGDGTKITFHTAEGHLGFFPCDRGMHSLAITSAGGFRAYDVLIPDNHVSRICTSEGVPHPTEFPAVPAFRDTLMEASLLRLSMRAEGHQVSEDIGDEIAARQILLRLCGFVGARRPDWHNDTSVFVPAVMRQLVDRIDAHLAAHLSLEYIANTVGLSPGHFARKFHRSAGLSLGRFMNQRRIGMSFGLLRDGTASLTRIALDLGFSSQSHFTRLFSNHTGMSPQHFRRQHVRMKL